VYFFRYTRSLYSSVSVGDVAHSTLCLKNAPLYILINSSKNEQIAIIFGAQNLEEILHQKIKNSPTSLE